MFMYRILFCLCFFTLFSGTALAEDGCKRFEGMWGPVYDKTYEAYAHMRPYMDGPSPAADSFIKGLVEARRIVINCPAKTIQSIQGEMPSEPRSFNIYSVNEQEMAINFIAARFINPGNELEQAMGEKLRKSAPRITFTFDGEYLKMSNPEHESFVMRRAAPFTRQ